MGLIADGEIEVEDAFFLWPENEPVFDLWLRLQTQWVVSDGIRVGLSYPGVEAYMRMSGVSKKKQARHIDLIQEMEQAALAGMADKHKKGTHGV